LVVEINPLPLVGGVQEVATTTNLTNRRFMIGRREDPAMGKVYGIVIIFFTTLLPIVVKFHPVLNHTGSVLQGLTTASLLGLMMGVGPGIFIATFLCMFLDWLKR